MVYPVQEPHPGAIIIIFHFLQSWRQKVPIRLRNTGLIYAGKGV
jgi:hypothetical protein